MIKRMTEVQFAQGDESVRKSALDAAVKDRTGLVPKSQVSNCVRCNKRFSIIPKSKKYCYACGFVFCGDCVASEHKWIPGKKKAKRVCLECVSVCSANSDIAWIPDQSGVACSICLKAFTLRNRRHHCRADGKIVCQDCSPAMAVVPGFRAQQRVCRSCFAHVPAAFRQTFFE